MIVWGGYFYDVASPLANTGGRNDPSTDSWTATGLINAPDARVGHTAVWTSTEMIVWGGRIAILVAFTPLTAAGDTILAPIVGHPPTPRTPPMREQATRQFGPALR